MDSERLNDLLDSIMYKLLGFLIGLVLSAGLLVFLLVFDYIKNDTTTINSYYLIVLILPVIGALVAYLIENNLLKQLPKIIRDKLTFVLEHELTWLLFFGTVMSIFLGFFLVKATMYYCNFQLSNKAFNWTVLACGLIGMAITYGFYKSWLTPVIKLLWWLVKRPFIIIFFPLVLIKKYHNRKKESCDTEEKEKDEDKNTEYVYDMTWFKPWDNEDEQKEYYNWDLLYRRLKIFLKLIAIFTPVCLGLAGIIWGPHALLVTALIVFLLIFLNAGFDI